MPGFTSPGLFFIGTVVPKEQWFLSRVFEGARHAGYTRFVEPAAGAFAMCGLARTVGWSTEQLDASDVSMLSAVLGAAAMGERVDALEIQLHEPVLAPFALDLGDPAHVLYAQMICRYLVKAHTVYWQEVVKDLLCRQEAILAELQQHLSRLHASLSGFRYRSYCMFQHLAEVLDDPTTIVSLNPPTMSSGFEKFYNTGGRLTWTEPTYGLFDPKTDLATLAEQCLGAKALVVLYEEQAVGQAHLPAVFARGGALKAKEDAGGIRTMAAYLSSNRPDEVEQLAQGRKIARREETGLAPAPHLTIIPPTHHPTEQSTVALVKLDGAQSFYYRQLWTHRFAGAQVPASGYGIVLDGYLCGVFAYDRSWLDRGEFGNMQKKQSLMLMYGSAARLPGYRLNRLLTKLALSVASVREFLDDLAMAKVTHLTTAQFSKYPESKEMRGMLTLAARKPIVHKFGLEKGFMLRYEAPLEPTTWQEAGQWWVKDERRYRTTQVKETA